LFVLTGSKKSTKNINQPKTSKQKNQLKPFGMHCVSDAHIPKNVIMIHQRKCQALLATEMPAHLIQ
jgi:hypothetical protein